MQLKFYSKPTPQVCEWKRLDRCPAKNAKRVGTAHLKMYQHHVVPAKIGSCEPNTGQEAQSPSRRIQGLGQFLLQSSIGKVRSDLCLFKHHPFPSLSSSSSCTQGPKLTCRSPGTMPPSGVPHMLGPSFAASDLLHQKKANKSQPLAAKQMDLSCKKEIQ